MLNTAVSLGRTGIAVEFISEVAADPPGEQIVSFLHENHVGTAWLNRYTEGKTTVALAFLDEKADASFSFYSDLPEKRLNGPLPNPGREDLVLFGSFFPLADGIHERIKLLLSGAAQNNAMIFYDPNFRRSHLPDLPRVIHRIEENISCADVIRGSDEDFLHIFALREPSEANAKIRTRENQVLIYTRAGEPVSIMTRETTLQVAVPGIKPVSTIGAGDSFNAGLIHAFITSGIGRNEMIALSAADWEKIAGNAIRFSQNVCLSLENYISPDFVISLGK